MKKKITLIIICTILYFFNTSIVNADISTERQLKDNKTILKIGNMNFYTNIELYLNYSNTNTNRKAFIGDLDVKYLNDRIYISVKRSQINNVILDTDKNIYGIMSINFDVYDVPESFYLLRMNNDNENCVYFVDFPEQQSLYNSYGFVETFGSGGEIEGSIVSHESTSSQYYFMNDSQITTKDLIDGSVECSKVNTSNAMLGIKPVIVFNIIEDVAADLKNIEEIVVRETGENENEVIKKSSVENFYVQYDNTQKLKYSWAIYDENGNPIEFNGTTKIDFDNSENKKEILDNLSQYEQDYLIDNMKFLSFEYSGELPGKAKITVYVGDKFKPNDIVTLYFYNPITKELEKRQENISTSEDGYVVFEVDHCSEYVLINNDIKVSKNISNNNISNNQNKKIDNANSNNKIIISIIIVVILISLILTIIIVKHKKSRITKTFN